MRPLARRLSAYAYTLLLAASLSACGGGGLGDLVDEFTKGGGGTSTSEDGDGAGVGAMSPSEQADADAVLALVNAERATSGLRPLRLDTAAADAAYDHAVDMDVRQYFDHYSPEGTSPGQRLTAAGCTFGGWAENIAMGQPTPAAVMTAWMNSPGHRANILSPNLTHVGVGVRYGTGTVYWVQDFLSR